PHHLEQPDHGMADPGIIGGQLLLWRVVNAAPYIEVPVFRGTSGSDCEEFIRAVYAFAFEKDRAKDDEWIATYAATRLSGKALRWYARQDKAVKLDWSALQVALLDQYPPSDDDDDDDDAIQPNAEP
ncbi:hypothetical protein FRC01_004410, partial [Tulasnella sp. 417]